jgi:TPR repeat protein
MRTLRIPALCLCLALAGCAVENSQELANTFASGVTAYDAGDKERAFHIWSAIADQDVAAMRNVAMMLRKGEGVKQDLPAAAAMYRRAAEAGLPTAQADLADMFLKGEAGPPNPKAALPLLAAAAAANHPVAQFELAQLYETGQDGLVPQNLETARTLYAAAASHGMPEAIEKMKQMGIAPSPTAPATTTAAAPPPTP